MVNPVQWVEIAVNSLEKAKVFYSKVFGLQFQSVEMPNSRMYMFGEPGGQGAGGALVQSDNVQPCSDGSVVYFACEDISDTMVLVEREGGRVLVPKTDIGDSGFFAHIIDTEGNRIGLLSDK